MCAASRRMGAASRLFGPRLPVWRRRSCPASSGKRWPASGQRWTQSKRSERRCSIHRGLSSYRFTAVHCTAGGGGEGGEEPSCGVTAVNCTASCVVGRGRGQEAWMVRLLGSCSNGMQLQLRGLSRKQRWTPSIKYYL